MAETKANAAGISKADAAGKTLFGRMNDPTAAAAITGPCGDSMEFYLVIRADVIADVRFYTEGCGNTRACSARTLPKLPFRRKTII